MAGAPIQIPGVELLEELGHGTYSVVYRARRGERDYAVKIPLRNETGIKLKLLGRRFRREAVALARLSHPLLPRVMEVGVVDRAPYIIMELATGETLTQRIARRLLAEDEAIELGRQLASVLRRVHDSGLVHRDVKPRNIVFDSEAGRLKLVDFGFAASIDAAFRILEPVGTLEYAAPEQVSDMRQRVDGRADLYAVGCVLYESLTGSPPFPGVDPKRLLHQHSGHQVPDVRENASHVSSAFASILKRLLARNPDDRYANAAALLDDLEHFDEIRSGERRRPAHGDHKAPSVLVPMLGRDKEMTRLRRVWSDVESGDPRIVVLRGPTGSGKTRLAQALFDHVVSRGHKTLGAKCHAWDPRPFSAIREIVEGNLPELAAPDQLTAARRITSLAGDLAPFLKVLSPTIASMLVNVAPVPQSQDAQHIFVEGLAEFLGKLFREMGPAIVFVDDLQWLDAGSRRVLRRAIDRTADSKILFVLATRGVPGEFAEVDRFLEGLEHTEIDIDKLDEHDAANLIRSYLGESIIHEDVVRSVIQLTDGTPLSTLEVLRMMLDDGQLLPSWGHWAFDADGVSQMHLPKSTLGVLERRIASLDDMTRSTLSAAAVVGMTFADRLLPSICRLEEGHTTAALAEARRAMLVEAARNGTHRFVHDSVREVLLRGMTEEDRREFDQRAAEAMDETAPMERAEPELPKASVRRGPLVDAGAARPSSVFVRGDPDADACYALANHYARGVAGRSPLRVYETNVAAGRLAFNSFDNERALEFFRSAESAATFLQLEPDTELGLLIGEAKLRVGFLERSREQFTRVLEMSDDPLHQALALSRIAWIYQLQLDSARAWEALEKAFAKLGERAPKLSAWTAIASFIVWTWRRFFVRPKVKAGRERQILEAVCSLYYQGVRLAVVDDKPFRIIESAFAGATEAERLGPSTSMARSYVTLSYVLTALGRRKSGRKYFELAQEIARSTADPVAIAHALQVHAVVAAWEGNFKTALDMGKRCLEEYGHWRELSEYCIITYTHQELLVTSGRDFEAWQWMDRIVDKVQHHDGDPFLMEVIELAARAALRSIGRERDAETRLRKLSELTIQIPDNSSFKVWTYTPRIRRYTALGELGPEFEAVVAEFEAKGLNPRRVHLGVTPFYMEVAHAWVHAVLRAPHEERGARIEKLARAFRDLKAAARVPMIRAHAIVIEGYLAMFAGSHAKARRMFAKAEELGQKENAPWVLYAVHRGRAHLLRTEDRQDAARDQARMAEALAVEHGMAPRLRWIREEFGLMSDRDLERDRARLLPWTSGLTAERSESADGQLQTLLRLTAEAPEQVDPVIQARAILEELVGRLRAERGMLYVSRTLSHEVAGKERLLTLLAQLGGNGRADDSEEASRALLERAFVDWDTEGAVGGYLLTAVLDRAVVAAPLTIDDTLVGAVYLDRDASRGAFTEVDGEHLVALASHAPLVLEFAKAVSSRNFVEEDLSKAQKVEAMSRLADGMAREFERVLKDIGTSTDALKSTNVNGARDTIQALQEAAARAEQLTRRLAAFSKDRVERTVPINVGERIRRTEPLLRELLGPNIALEFRAEPRLPFIRAEQSDIEHMLVTLAIRARDVMPHGGSLVVETSSVMLGDKDARVHPAAQQGPYVRMSISDTGRALEPEERREILDAMIANRDGDRAGSGLALRTMCRRVARSRGFVDVESIVSEGTTFMVYWPSIDGAVAPRTSVPGASGLPRGTETILVVEQEPMFGDALGRVLSGLGYRVLRASDGIEALRLVAARSLEVHMVISDVTLHGMNGLELGRELLKMRKTLRMLYLSDSSEELVGSGAMVVDPAALLPKPVHQDVLATRVREVLDRRPMS